MYKKLSCCKYCSLNFLTLSRSEIANHSRWCHSNPKRSEYKKANNCSQMQTADAIAKRSEKIKQAHANGKYTGSHQKAVETKKINGKLNHTEKTKQHLKEKALASPHRRLVRSIRQYIKKDGTIINLDSSWEEALATRLDEINVNWIRPNPIKWIDEKGISHNYFPDFYLIDFDIYLDPKNPYAIKAQQAKIKCLTEQIKNLIIIKGLEECKNYTPDQIRVGW